MKDELVVLEEQEELLRFPKFNEETAWELGSAMRNRALQGSLPVAICIESFGRVLFRCDLPGTAPDNGAWIEGKTRTVYRFGRSSMYIGTKLRQKGQSISDVYFVSETDYRAHGGCFPIRLEDGLLVGTVTVSGLAQEDDHRFVVESLAQWLEKPL